MQERRKQILFLIPSLGGGGAERVLVNLVNNLDKSKYEVTVQTLFDIGVNRNYLQEHVTYIPGFRKEFPGNTKILKLFPPKVLYRLLVRKPYDIVVSYLEGPTARIVAGCPFEATKLVSWIHVEQHSLRAAAYSFRSSKEAQKCYETYNQIICVAETVKEDFCSIFPTLENCNVFYNTNEDEKIVERSTETVDDVQFSDEINIVSVGRLKPEKGYDRLVLAHKKLLEQDIKNQVYILGTGPEEDLLRQLIQEQDVEDTFHLLGFRDNPYKYVAKGDLFICSSRREGFSTAVTEALILGIPVVSTLCSGAKELLGTNDEWGIITENSKEGVLNGLYQILTIPGLLEHYKEKAEERGKFFSKENTIKAVEQMFDNLLKEE